MTDTCAGCKTEIVGRGVTFEGKRWHPLCLRDYIEERGRQQRAEVAREKENRRQSS